MSVDLIISLRQFLVIMMPVLPLLPLLIILTRHILRWGVAERFTYQLTQFTYVSMLSSILITACSMLITEDNILIVNIASWIMGENSGFKVIFTVDWLALCYGGFSLLMAWTVAAFSRRYLHREAGFDRFYALLSLLVMGLVVTCFAGSLNVLIIGWELVGVSSTLLIAFFNHRSKPVRNALRAFVTYRACDIGLLFVLLLLHDTISSTEFSLSGQLWAGLPGNQEVFQATIISVALTWAAMGKSAQVPLSGWLPRAMEGPTPSSAIFYGALSVHLGPFLLLRASEIIEQSGFGALLISLVGIATALHGRKVGSVQTDIKSKLAYGSILQVGLIFIEIGLGWYQLALLHMVGHGSFRALQILRAPNLLHDRTHLEQMLGHFVSPSQALDNLTAHSQSSISGYRRTLDRGGFDALLRDNLIYSVLELLRRIDAMEQRTIEHFARWVLGLVTLSFDKNSREKSSGT